MPHRSRCTCLCTDCQFQDFFFHNDTEHQTLPEPLPSDGYRNHRCKEVPERFHAQLNATSKTYVYRMTIDDVPSVFDRKYTYHCYRIPDKRLMQQAAEKLTGRHDFRNFSSAKKTKSTVREIFDIDIYGDIEEMQILIHADDFLHNMARIIVGTLMDIGLGNRSVQDIDDIFAGILEASAPCDPKGLYLQEITY